MCVRIYTFYVKFMYNMFVYLLKGGEKRVGYVHAHALHTPRIHTHTHQNVDIREMGTYIPYAIC